MEASIKENKIYKPGYTLELMDNNVLYLKIDGTAKITLDKVKELKKIVLEVVENNRFKNIVDFGKNSGVLTTEAKKFIANDKEFIKLKICDALITSSFTTSFLIGAYINIFKPKTPTKTFSDFDSALEWANKF